VGQTSAELPKRQIARARRSLGGREVDPWCGPLGQQVSGVGPSREAGRNPVRRHDPTVEVAAPESIYGRSQDRERHPSVRVRNSGPPRRLPYSSSGEPSRGCFDQDSGSNGEGTREGRTSTVLGRDQPRFSPPWQEPVSPVAASLRAVPHSQRLSCGPAKRNGRSTIGGGVVGACGRDRMSAPSPRKFIRDGRAPLPARESVSRVMSRNAGRDTSPELRLRSLLRAASLTGYRVHRTDLPGRPDLSFGRTKTAVFLHGCFWHRCPRCRKELPKTHREFWAAKFRANRARDRRKEAELRSYGWRVVVVWECELRDTPSAVVARIARAAQPRRGTQESLRVIRTRTGRPG
jgi:DNA mismatch endonuclease (patch repair protein)